MKTNSIPSRVLIALNISGFLVPFTGSALNLALPQLVETFHMSAVVLTLVVSSYLVTTAIFQVPAARLADIVGRKKVFVTGLALLVVFSILSAAAWSSLSLIVFRLLSGIGSACVFGTNMAILSDVFPSKERGKALGIYTAVVYAAVAVGPVLGGLVAHYFAWRGVFFSGAVIGIPALVMSLVWIKDEWLPAKGEPFDYQGSIVFAIALSCIILGCSFLPGVWAWPLLVVGVVGIGLFMKLMEKAAFPVINLELFFTNRHFRLSSLSAMINYSASFALGFILSLYLQYVKGMDVRQAGFVLMIQPIIQTIVSPLSGRYSDKINPSIMTTSGMAIITVALVILTGIGPDTSIVFIAIVMAAVGFGFGIFSSPNVNIIMGSVQKRYYGLASATTGTARLIGQAMSLAIATMAIHAHMGDEKMSVENSDLFLASMKTAFFIFAALCAAGVYTSASKIIGKYAKEEWRAQSQRMSARLQIDTDNAKNESRKSSSRHKEKESEG